MVAVLKSRKTRAEETRRKLFLAARGLFEERGYSATTIDTIVQRAGVAKGTFFVHFATKDAVITELIGIQFGKARDAQAAALACSGPLAALRATVLTIARQAGCSRRLSRAVIAATLETQAVGDLSSHLFEQALAQMIADARAAGAQKPEALARALMTSYLGVVLHFTTTPRTPPLIDMLTPLIDAQLKELDHEPKHCRPVRRARR